MFFIIILIWIAFLIHIKNKSLKEQKVLSRYWNKIPNLSWLARCYKFFWLEPLYKKGPYFIALFFAPQTIFLIKFSKEPSVVRKIGVTSESSMNSIAPFLIKTNIDIEN